MRGGLVFFRGAGAAARAYLESDHSHADEYYLEDGGAVASWTALGPDGAVLSSAELDGADYQAWVDWKDPATGLDRGTPRDEVRLRVDGELRITPSSPRFVEMTVNCDKSLSVAAALDPAVSQALDAAQASAAEAMNTYMSTHSVTRVGVRGAQRLVPVERLESVSVVHRSSRAGDPHRHLHVQWNTRLFAEGKWGALHTAATLKQQGALRGVGEAAINSHAELRQALAAAGFEFDASTGTVTNLAAHAKVMSKRAQQIDRNVLRLEAEWRGAHPGQEPDAALRRQWDQQAWALERPRKRQIEGRPENKWIEELRDASLPSTGSHRLLHAPRCSCTSSTVMRSPVTRSPPSRTTDPRGRSRTSPVAWARPSPDTSPLTPARSTPTCRVLPATSHAPSRPWKQRSWGRSPGGCATSPATVCCASKVN